MNSYPEKYKEPKWYEKMKQKQESLKILNEEITADIAQEEEHSSCDTTMSNLDLS